MVADNRNVTEERLQRDARINIRVASSQAALLKRAADAQSRSLSEFVLSSASVAAEQVLADRRWFQLDDDAWAAFEAALERPAVLKPKLLAALREDNFFVD